MSRAATEAPMPLAAPVTSAVRPARGLVSDWSIMQDPLLSCETAVDCQHSSADERRFVTSEEQHTRCDLVWEANSAHRRKRQRRCVHLTLLDAHHIRVDEPRQNDIRA